MMLPPYAAMMRITLADGDPPRLVLPFRDHVVGRPGFLHGGAIGGLLEMAAIVALRAAAGEGVRIKPVNLTVDYMRGGRDADTWAEGVIRRQVGKGSFLVKTPWSEAHHRVGFFYNRDIVGGGIFNNDFYTKLVVAFEKAVVSDGHEFVLGSFTHKSMPIHLYDALDVVVLTGITQDTDLSKLPETSSQVAIMDLVI